MINFYKENKNPKGRNTGDCVTRALASTLNITWEQALTEQYEVAVKTGYGITNKEVFDKVLQKYGWIKCKQPKRANGKKYKVGEIDELLTGDDMYYGVFISLANHCTCVVDYCLSDTWDCRNKTISNYWVRKAV